MFHNNNCNGIIRRVSRREANEVRKRGMMITCDCNRFSCLQNNINHLFYCCSVCGHANYAICEQCYHIENEPRDIIADVLENGISVFDGVPPQVVDRIICANMRMMRDQMQWRYRRHRNCKMPVIYIDGLEIGESAQVTVELSKIQKFTVIAPPFTADSYWDVQAITRDGEQMLSVNNIPTDSLFYETSKCDLCPTIESPLLMVPNAHIFEVLINHALIFGLNIQRATMFAQFWAGECCGKDAYVAFIVDQKHLEEEVSKINIECNKEVVVRRFFVHITTQSASGAMRGNIVHHRSTAYHNMLKLDRSVAPVVVTEWGGIIIKD